MKAKNIVIAIVGIVAVVIVLIVGLWMLRQPGGGKNRNQDNVVKSLQPNEDLGECTVVGYAKDTQAYKQVVGVDSNLLSLDIYSPKTKGACSSKYPLMVFVHGGGWQNGDKANKMEDKPAYFTGQGYVFVSLNYRLSPAVMYPVHNQDVASAIKWLSDNAPKYSATNINMIIMGHSAGGGIISAISTNEKYLGDVGLPLSTLKCAVSLDADGYDITVKAAESTMVYRPAFGTDAGTWPDASPINHISANKGIPSFFMVTRGSAERVGRAKTFQQKLTQSGVSATLIETPSLDHEGVNAAVGDSSDNLITPKLQEFLDTKCK